MWTPVSRAPLDSLARLRRLGLHVAENPPLAHELQVDCNAVRGEPVETRVAFDRQEQWLEAHDDADVRGVSGLAVDDRRTDHRRLAPTAVRGSPSPPFIARAG